MVKRNKVVAMLMAGLMAVSPISQPVSIYASEPDIEATVQEEPSVEEDIQEEDGTIHAEPAHMYVQNGKRETTQALSAMMIIGETNRALTL